MSWKSQQHYVKHLNNTTQKHLNKITLKHRSNIITKMTLQKPVL